MEKIHNLVETLNRLNIIKKSYSLQNQINEQNVLEIINYLIIKLKNKLDKTKRQLNACRSQLQNMDTTNIVVGPLHCEMEYIDVDYKELLLKYTI